MVLAFYKKNEEFYKKHSKEDCFLYPSDRDMIAEYTIMEAIDKPLIGDLVTIKGGIYKVFQMMTDYDEKTVFAIVEVF